MQSKYETKHKKYKQKYLKLQESLQLNMIAGAIENRRSNLNNEKDKNNLPTTTQLVKMPIMCDGTNGINQFVLQRQINEQENLNKIFYEYKCVVDATRDGNHLYHNFEYKNTQFNDYHDGSTYYLDRHEIDCNGKPISSINLEKIDNQIRYNYKCANVPLNAIDTLIQNQTANNDPGNGQNIYLDRHNITCPDEQVLTNLKLNTVNNSGKLEINYSYKCARPSIQIYEIPHHMPDTQSWLFMPLIYCNYTDINVMFPPMFEHYFNQCVLNYNNDQTKFGNTYLNIFGALDFGNFYEFKQIITRRLEFLNIRNRTTILNKTTVFQEDGICHLPGNQQENILYFNQNETFLELLVISIMANLGGNIIYFFD
jgi:hypothetical protein